MEATLLEALIFGYLVGDVMLATGLSSKAGRDLPHVLNERALSEARVYSSFGCVNGIFNASQGNAGSTTEFKKIQEFKDPPPGLDKAGSFKLRDKVL